MSSETGSSNIRKPVRKTERRKERRTTLLARYPVLITTPERDAKGEEPIPGLLTDINRQGLGIISNGQIRAGVKVIIKLQIRRAFGRELHAIAIWSNPLPSAHRILKENDDFWRVGLNFGPEADPGQQELLTELLRLLQG